MITWSVRSSTCLCLRSMSKPKPSRSRTHPVHLLLGAPQKQRSPHHANVVICLWEPPHLPRIRRRLQSIGTSPTFSRSDLFFPSHNHAGGPPCSGRRPTRQAAKCKEAKGSTSPRMERQALLSWAIPASLHWALSRGYDGNRSSHSEPETISRHRPRKQTTAPAGDRPDEHLLPEISAR